jgi:hypothetical protein
LSLEEIDLVLLREGSLQDSHEAKILSHQILDSASEVATLEEGSGSEKVAQEEIIEIGNL